MTHSNAVADAHHDEHRDDVGTRMGMWLFLFTELLLFGGLFLAYAVFRIYHPDQFKLAGLELDTMLGAVNTVILLTSSLTMVLSIAAIQRGQKFISLLNLGLTIAFALVFLVNKFFEWSYKFHHDLYPGTDLMNSKGNGERMFFGLYYVMTGLHGLHIIIGIVILAFMFFHIMKDNINKDKYVFLENGGLYWHLVDLIWIFLFPLFYLIR